MPRYVAFLRGVSPMNANMAELKRSFASAGFMEVKTVLSSGNVAFSASSKPEAALARQAEAAMAKQLGRSFYTVVRSASTLRDLVQADPFASFVLPANGKRVVTFLWKPHKNRLSLPIEADGVRVLAMSAGEVFTDYVPSRRGPVFMTMIEKIFGKNVTTRTWETLRKCSIA